MQSDRELLELAAKAAGIDAEVHSELGLGEEGLWLKGKRSPDNSKYWNPLTDDGDALRLAVKRRMHFEIVDGWSVCYAGSVMAKQFSERHGEDENAATRRAIVRAAAAIGGDSNG